MKKHFALLRQLVLFGLVGGASLLIDVVVTTFLYNICHFPASASGMIGFTSAFFFNFPINRKHVFQHSPKDRLSLKWQIIFYVSLSLFNLVMTGLLMDWIVSSGLLTISLAKICVSAVIATWNFLLFKFFIFSKRPDFTDVEGLIVQ